MSATQPTDSPPPRPAPPDDRPAAEDGPLAKGQRGAERGGWEKAKVLATVADIVTRVFDIALHH